MFGLNEEQIVEFNRRFKSAVNYIMSCQIINEYRSLNDNERILNDWQRNRLAELQRMEIECGRNLLEEKP